MSVGRWIPLTEASNLRLALARELDIVVKDSVEASATGSWRLRLRNNSHHSFSFAGSCTALHCTALPWFGLAWLDLANAQLHFVSKASVSPLLTFYTPSQKKDTQKNY
jgi:hypothetical protein